MTLTADDGAGDGVANIQYAIDGGSPQTYDGPITISSGDHEIAYFATDNAEEPNVEDAKTVGVRVDSLAPVTGVQQSSGGAQRTRHGHARPPGRRRGLRRRGDAVPRRRRPVEDLLRRGGRGAVRRLGRLAADLGAGRAGRFELMRDGSDGITPIGGLGMLWYPVEQFGDFRMKFQFREGRTDGSHSNGGAFTRFPDPRTPVEQRPDACAKTGNAANDPAWVAIYCGHEIQLYDGPDGEPQKTGSIYNFDARGLGDIGEPKDIGEWNDYEIEVVGQHYKITRNGEVINEFDNTPGQQSSRGGDPPTDLRQFATGYIGLQNHGGADRMQYRDIRVEDLSADAPARNQTGPFTVSGVGGHTVEVRSIDAAGNVESKRPVDVQIGGGVGPQGTPPMTPPVLDTPATYRLGKIAKRVSARSFAKRGLKVRVACTGAMSGSVRLTVGRAAARKLALGSRTIKDRRVRCYGAHTATVTLKPSKPMGRKLRRGKGNLTLRLTVRMVDFGKPAQTITRTIMLRR